MKSRLFSLRLVALLGTLLGGTGLFLTLNHPSMQKRWVLAQLPANSSILRAEIGWHAFELHQLKIPLADGTQIQIKSLRADMAPLSWLLQRRVQLENLELKSVKIDRRARASESRQTLPQAVQAGQIALNQLAQFNRPVFISTLQAQGQILLSKDLQLEFSLKSNSIAPGRSTTVLVQSTLRETHPFQDWVSGPVLTSTEISIHQKSDSGFDTIELKSSSEAQDMQASCKLQLDAKTLTAHAAAEFEFKLPASQVLPPELAGLTPIAARLSLQAALAGNELKLTAAKLNLATDTHGTVQLQLAQTLSSTNYHELKGELLHIQLYDFQLATFNPWLPHNYSLQSSQLKLKYTLSRDQRGYFQLSPERLLTLKNVQLIRGHDQPMLRLNILAAPQIEISPDYNIKISDDTVEISDSNGPLLSASSTVQLKLSARPRYQATIAFQLNTMPLLKQPALAGKFQCHGANIHGQLQIDTQAPFPLKLSAKLKKPTTRTSLHAHELQFKVQATPSNRDSWLYQIDAASSDQPQPSSQLHLNGAIHFADSPLHITGALTSSGFTQTDLQLLLAEFKTTNSPDNKPRLPTRAGNRQKIAFESGNTAQPSSPPWPAIRAKIQAEIASVKLNSGITLEAIEFECELEPYSLAVRELQIQLQGGSLTGEANSHFDPNQNKAFRSSCLLTFNQIDPSSFERDEYTIPLRGKFNGALRAAGSSQTWLGTWEKSLGELRLDADAGSISAFQLKPAHRWGMAGAEWAGRGLATLLDNDRINTTTQSMLAIIPYFQEIPFQQFSLTLSRKVAEAIDITELKIQNPELQIQATGAIFADPLFNLMQHPMLIDLSLSSRGSILTALDNLDLLAEPHNASEFVAWNEILQIGGSLAAPDTTAISQLLSHKAQSTIQLKPKSANQQQVIDPIKIGFDALESLLAP